MRVTTKLWGLITGQKAEAPVTIPRPTPHQADAVLAAADAHAPWLRRLLETQQELGELVTSPFYAEPQRGTYPDGTSYEFPAYRSAEAFYWTCVPRWIAEDAQRRPVRRSLDVGCSYGTLSLLTHKTCGAEIFLCDFIDAYMSARLLARPGFHFKVCTIELEPVPFEGTFDQILFTEVIEHLNFHPVPTLRKLAERLAPDGWLYLTTPDAADHGKLAYYARWQDMPMPHRRDEPPIDAHIYQFAKDELLEVVHEAGLVAERIDWAPGYGGGSMRHLNLACRRRATGR